MKYSLLAPAFMILGVGLLASCTLTKEATTSVTTPTHTTMTGSNTGLTSPQYQNYNSESVAQMSGKPYALFFHAAWCPACARADKQIKTSLSSLPENTSIFKVDYDSNMELRKKYGVTSQHTIVFFDEKGEVTNKVMGFDIEDIKKNFK